MNIAQILRQRAEQSPGKTAYTFIHGDTEECLDYGTLDAMASRIGSCLRELIVPGDRVVLLYPPGLSFIAGLFGCFYSQAIAVPAYPPATGRSGRNLKRLQGILADAQPKLALCGGNEVLIAESLFQNFPELKSLHWMNTDDISSDRPSTDEISSLTDTSLAFLQYTSGSTSDSKGVMVTHHNLMHNLRTICEAFGHSGESRGVIWLPPYHDMGLIGGILQPLYAGFPVTLMAPTTFLQKPHVWLKAISDSRATTSGGPNSAYDLCVQRISDEQKSRLDLSSWNVAFTGAEPVRLKTINAFADAFRCCGFRREAFLPCYGLAEATLMVTGFRERTNPVLEFNCSKASLEKGEVKVAGTEEGRVLIACGTPDSSTRVRIVNPESRTPSGPAELGEIWVTGPGIAAGYWKKPDLSEEVFRAVVAGDPSGGNYLRTGDLGFMVKGRVHVAGRIKDLIIIRGSNYYPQDIELAVAGCHPALNGGAGAAFSVEIDGEERLVIAQEVNRHFKDESTSNVIEAVRSAVVREHELAIHAVALVRPGRIPKTSSGKVQRYVCRDLFLKNQLDTVVVEMVSAQEETVDRIERRDFFGLSMSQRSAAIEERLRQWLKNILKVETLSSGEFDLYHAGLDSLMLVDFQHWIHREFGVELPYSLLFEIKGMAQLTAEICRRMESTSNDPGQSRPETPLSRHPLSHNQKALWFLHQADPENPAYNIVAAASIQGQLNREALTGAFRDLCLRHDSLHTRFEETSEDPVRISHLKAEPLIVFEDAVDWNPQILDSRVKAAARVRFDLRAECPAKIFLFKRGEQDHLMVWVTHHIACDFWSFGILFPELEALYVARASGQRAKLPPVEVTYADYVSWQTELLKSDEKIRLRDFWNQQIITIPHVALPGRQGIAEQKPGGATHFRKLDSHMAKAVRMAAIRAGLTLNEFCLAAFVALLHRYTGQETLVLGIPSSGRAGAQFRNLVGYCVSPLLIRVEMDKDMSFSALCDQVKRRVRQAVDHQNYPVPLIFKAMGDRRGDMIHTGVQIMFAFHNTSRLGKAGPFLLGDANRIVRWGDLTLQPCRVNTNAAQFEMMLGVVESENELHSAWQYRTDLFDASAVERMAGHWETLLAGIVRDPNETLLGHEILGAAEKRLLLSEWNRTAVEYPNGGTLHELFETQVERTPDAVAVVFEGQQLTYRGLNENANRLAHHLRRMGVGPEVVVPLCMERSLELVVGMMAVLKAGGAYMPLEPTDPAERILAMLAGTKISAILTQQRFAGLFAGYDGQVLSLDRSEPLEEPECNTQSGSQPDNLAYVIYTSGSTGTPKGAMNTYRGICNRLQWMQDKYGLNPDDRVLQKTPYTFDVSVWEFFWPLIAGARLVLAKPGGQRDAGYLCRLIQEQKITTMHFVPSMLQVFLEDAGVRQCSSLKRVICSGEALPFELAKRFHERLDVELHNLYGPTEASVDVTSWECPKKLESKVIPIGKPIANIQAYILDGRLSPVPVGMNGEIYLGGIGLGRGYRERPDLTAEKFVPNPFGAEGDRLYRTGDIGRYGEDGNIEWVGRTDHQVKIRGHRIELGEIESALNGHEKIRESVVITRDDGTGNKQLVAYTVSKSGDSPTSVELRSFLSSKLPDYMVPSVFQTLQELPLTSSGKVDRKKLPAPNGEETRETEYVAPRTPAEESLVRIWEEVLGQKRVGIHDNFFHIGGHSLLMARIANRIRSQFHVEVPMAKFFQGPTVARIAEVIVRQAAEEKNANDVSALLDELERLSASDVEKRLQNMASAENLAKGAG